MVPGRIGGSVWAKYPCNANTAATYRGTSLIRNTPPVGPYSSRMPRVLGGSQGGGLFLMSEVPLYPCNAKTAAIYATTTETLRPCVLCEVRTASTTHRRAYRGTSLIRNSTPP